MRSLLTAYLFSLTLVACTDSGTDDLSQRNDVTEEEDCQCKIEGADIGRVGVAAKPPGSTTIRVAEWIEKEGSPGEYVGFTLWGYAGTTYVVKAGTETFRITGESWSHPAGASGPSAHGISNVDFCPDDDGGGGGDDDPPTDDGPPIL